MRVFGLVWKSAGKKPGEFQRVGHFSSRWDKPIYKEKRRTDIWKGGCKREIADDGGINIYDETDVYPLLSSNVKR